MPRPAPRLVIAPRLAIAVIGLLVALILLLVVLAGRASERPTTQVEQSVSLENLA